MIPTYMMNEEEYERFGQLGGSYNSFKQEMADFIKSKIKSGSDILDLGCGEGVWGLLLKDNGYNIDAVDVWPKAVEHAEYCGLYRNCTLANVVDFEYKQNYKLSIFADVLEHLTIEEAQKVVKNIEQHSDHVLIAVPYNNEQDALYDNQNEIHKQPELTAALFAERYPGYHVIYQNEGYAYYWKDINPEEQDLKICVYAICKNESKFVEDWLTNMSEADYIVVLDTGSTDGTYDLLKKDNRVTKVVKKQIKPWRFDVARNESMELIPDDADILVCTDFDELFNTGWANHVRSAWKQGLESDINRLLYSYAWSHDPSGTPTDIFKYDKIHNRDYKWKFPVHEVLTLKDSSNTVKAADISKFVQLEHFRDTSKPRAYYMDLLKLSCKENPDNAHVQMLLAREYLLDNDYDNAIIEYEKAAEMPAIDDEENELVLLETMGRLASLQLHKKRYSSAIWYCNEFINLNKTYREPYLIMAEAYVALEMYDMAKAIIEVCLKRSERSYTWVERANTWTTWPDELLFVCDYYLGNIDDSLKHLDVCLKHDPDNVTWLKYYVKMLKEKYGEKIDD